MTLEQAKAIADNAAKLDPKDVARTYAKLRLGHDLNTSEMVKEIARAISEHSHSYPYPSEESAARVSELLASLMPTRSWADRLAVAAFRLSAASGMIEKLKQLHGCAKINGEPFDISRNLRA